MLGVPLAVPIGALTFVLGYIPLVGATAAGAVAVAVAFGVVGLFLAVPVVGAIVAGAVAYHQSAAAGAHGS